MFDKYALAVFSVLLAGLLLVPLAGCQQGVEKFAVLDSDGDGVLTASELDVNGDQFVTPEELQIERTYTRPLDKFFADGGSAEDKALTEQEFARAVRGEQMPPWQILTIVVVVLGFPVVVGVQTAKRLRMPDYGWKIALILLSLTAGVAITYFGWPPKRGIDLSGGVILIYEIDEEATLQQAAGEEEGEEGEPRELRPDEQIRVGDLVEQLRRRINPGGVKEIVIRPYGERQVEIIIPEVEAAEVEYIKKVIGQTGQLEFLIVATPRKHQDMISRAMEPQRLASRERLIKQEINGEVTTVGRWVPVGVEEKMRGKEPDYRGVSLGDILRARKGQANSFEEVVVPPDVQNEIASEKLNLRQALEQVGYRDLQVLMAVNPNERLNIRGRHLRSATQGFDNTLNPAVNFTMTGNGAQLMATLTSSHLPDKTADFYYRLGIVMDGELISAPRLISTISSIGQITGRFTEQEVRFLVGVLKAGRLPAVMRKDPISESEISALLGEDTIRKGGIAIGLSLSLVLVFILIYYRFAGIVACAAMLLNLLLVVAVMIKPFNAAFTLPGLAGLVLTVGMSVDANVLIFERIREELSRGAALRMAIRNGFARATTTIVDANITTFITGSILYVIGTEQIRGFAVTLCLGIVLSMYTAIFCSRVVFEIAERRRWITKLGMAHLLGETSIDFLSRRRIAALVSIVLIVVGMGALVARGRGIFDIDFNGGTSVQILLKEPMPIEDVRHVVADGSLGDTSVSKVQPEGFPDNTVFKIDSSITGEEPPDEGDPVIFTPPGAAESSTFIVTAVSQEQQAADLQSPDGSQTFDAVPWDRIDRDGVAIVQDRLKKIFGDKLERRSLKIESLASDGPAEERPPPSPPAENNNGTGDGDPPADSPQPDADAGDTDANGDSGAEDVAPADAESGDSETGDTEAGDDDTTGDSDANDTTPADDADDTGDSAGGSAPDDEGALLGAGPLTLVSFQGEESPADDSDTVPDEADTPADDEATEAEEDPDVSDDDLTAPAAVGPEEGTVAEVPGEDESRPETGEEGEDIEVELVASAGNTKAKLIFGHAVSAATVRAAIQGASEEVLGNIDLPSIYLSNPNWDGESGQRFREWNVVIPLGKSAAEEVLANIQADMAASPVWLSANKIGAQVAGDLQQMALAALITSLLGIIGYIWIRFQRVVFGLAAVVALVHDVLITLGAIAISLWLSKVFGFLLVEEFKISLPVVAALLTIIGYSLNDTIVVFDRIREVRGKNPDLTAGMINTSINQTLSRTVLTSATTLIVVGILYALGGQAIRGFAYALLVGVVVGTYSSVFVASPALLWMMQIATRETAKPEKSKALA